MVVRRIRGPKSYELLGISEESKVSDPDIIRISDEANEMLKTLCEITNCGRGGIVEAAIRVLAEKFLENDDFSIKTVSQVVNNRSVLEIARDNLEKI